MESLVPAGVAADDHLQLLLTKPLLRPFSEEALSFVQALSQSILRDYTLKRYPELVSMAYWLRRQQIQGLAHEFQQQNSTQVRLPRGIVFHIAPANVDTIFVYSWLLSLLVGNSNIVRLSQKRNEQLALLLSRINSLLAEEEHRSIRERTLLVSYEHNRQTTESLSACCHLRIVWGGDETVAQIRAIPLPALATELVFADRFSLCLLRAEALLGQSDDSYRELAHHFYNDAFWFDQLACSSPRLIVWIGDKQRHGEAQQRFWSAVVAKIQEKQYQQPAAIGIQRLTTAYALAAQQEHTLLHSTTAAAPTRLELPTLQGSDFRSEHCGGGLFLEHWCPSLTGLAAVLQAKDQTLSVFGFSREELTAWVQQLPPRAVDRIVPIGKALEFGTVWDGQDLLSTLTRAVVIW
jgi:hypothetical protein